MEKKKVADNLYVYTRDNGNKFYVFRGTIAGRRVEKTIGRFEHYSIKEAKREVGLLLNTEPEEEKSAETFGEMFPVILDAIAKLRMWKNDRSYKQWNQSITDYAMPFLKDKPVAEVTRQDVIAVLEPIWYTKSETASRVQQRLEEVFNWCITRELRKDYNPAAWRGNLELFLPAKGKVKRVKHQTAPTMEELRLITKYCLAHPGAVSGCILFVLATVCRVTEARSATASEIKGGVWTIPTEHQKVAKESGHRVPLSTLAKDALAMANGETYLFEGQTPGKMIALDTPRLKIVSVCPRDGDQITIHGVRSTFRDWCAENGVRDDEAEKALNHEWGDATTAAYYRSDLLKQRQALMQRWADALTAD